MSFYHEACTALALNYAGVKITPVGRPGAPQTMPRVHEADSENATSTTDRGSGTRDGIVQGLQTGQGKMPLSYKEGNSEHGCKDMA